MKSHTGPTARARAARLARPTCVERLEGRTLLAAAPGAQLAADINTGTGMTFYSGGVDVNGTLLFRSPDALWRSDGTAAGTVPVRTGLYLEFDSFYGGMFAAGGKAYFLARSDPLEAAPRGLWVSDGTAAGTRMLFSSETLLPAAAAGNSVYFWRWGAEGGLWKSDGTDAGTVRVRDMAANAAAQSMAYNPADGRVYFNAIAAGTGLELWSTDGTDAGTRLVKDINPGPADGSVTNVTASHGKVFFSATPAGSAQAQPFVTDGTAAGTVMLKQIASFTNITPSGYTPAGPNANAAGRTVFTAAGHLYSTDGTPAGTVQLDTNQSPEPRDLTRSGNTVFYSANQRLWATDGTAAGTKMLSNATTGVPSNPLRMVDLNGTLLFRSGSGGAGTNLWKSNGTVAGTTQFWQHPYHASDFYYQPLAVSGAAGTRKLFFLFDDGVIGRELYSTDGTSNGTRLVKDIDTRPLSSDPEFGAAFGGDYLVSAHGPGPEGAPRAWWRVDGDGVAPPLNTGVADVVTGSNGFPIRLRAFNGALLYDVGNHGVYRTDGTAAGTEALGVERLSEYTEYKGRLYFISGAFSYTNVIGTDGTRAGTAPLLPDTAGTNVSSLAATGQYLYFAGRPIAAEGEELWRSDGTPQGTTRLFTWQKNATGGYIDNLFTLGDRLYFTWETPEGTELYAVPDGQSSPVLVGLLPWVIRRSNNPVKVGNQVYLVGFPAGGNDEELVATDGTLAGTHRVKDFSTDPGWGSFPDRVAALGGRLLVWAYADEPEKSLWITDGTESGTTRLTPPGLHVLIGAMIDHWNDDFAEPGRFAVVGGRFYFIADDPAHGREVWVTDGTPQGTRLAADVIPGPTGSNPKAFAAVGDTLFFAADHPSVGREVWKIPAGAPAPTAAVSRLVFYNNSLYDGRRSAADAGDDGAIATDKRAAFPGQTPGFENLSSYSRGINGIMIDVQALPVGPVTAADFAFRVRTARNAGDWAPLAAQPQVSVRRGAGVNGTDRVTLTFPDGTARNAWLEVAMLANARTGLSFPDTFTFGNLVGETGRNLTFSAPPKVDALDVAALNAARRRGTVSITDAFDFNRDGRVNVLDQVLVRQNLGLSLPTTAPAGISVAAAATPPRRSNYFLLHR